MTLPTIEMRSSSPRNMTSSPTRDRLSPPSSGRASPGTSLDTHFSPLLTPVDGRFSPSPFSANSEASVPHSITPFSPSGLSSRPTTPQEYHNQATPCTPRSQLYQCIQTGSCIETIIERLYRLAPGRRVIAVVEINEDTRHIIIKWETVPNRNHIDIAPEGLTHTCRKDPVPGRKIKSYGIQFIEKDGQIIFKPASDDFGFVPIRFLELVTKTIIPLIQRNDPSIRIQPYTQNEDPIILRLTCAMERIPHQPKISPDQYIETLARFFREIN